MTLPAPTDSHTDVSTCERSAATGPGERLGHTLLMGFNPHRPRRAKPSDVAFVVAGLLVAVALLVWAFFG